MKILYKGLLPKNRWQAFFVWEKEKQLIMKKILFGFLIILIFALPAHGARLHKEKEYQAVWCRQAGGITEYVLDDNTRIDCLTDEHAIEFDFSDKWAEAVGQSLYYAIKTGKKAGVVLILEKKGSKHLERLQLLSEHYNIKVWTMSPKDINNHNNKERRHETR